MCALLVQWSVASRLQTTALGMSNCRLGSSTLNYYLIRRQFEHDLSAKPRAIDSTAKSCKQTVCKCFCPLCLSRLHTPDCECQTLYWVYEMSVWTTSFVYYCNKSAIQTQTTSMCAWQLLIKPQIHDHFS